MLAQRRRQNQHVSPSATRLVSWNGVAMHVPATWEAVVSGDRHLLCNDDLRTVAEMRWHPSAPGKAEAMIDSCLRQLQTGSRAHWTPSAAPGVRLPDCEVFCFYDQSRKLPLLFLWHGPTSLFLMLQLVSGEAEADFWQCVRSIRCYGGGDKVHAWSIQDFRITVPASFSLHDYSLAAGRTSLHLRSPGTDLHVCRLANAAMRLRGHGQEDILLSLLREGEPSRSLLSRRASELRMRRAPGLLHRLSLRLRRQKPFLIACLRHHPEADRLLCMSMASTTTVDDYLFEEIWASYEIL